MAGKQILDMLGNRGCKVKNLVILRFLSYSGEFRNCSQVRLTVGDLEFDHMWDFVNKRMSGELDGQERR